MHKFDHLGSYLTPKKAVFVVPFPKVDNDSQNDCKVQDLESEFSPRKAVFPTPLLNVDTDVVDLGQSFFQCDSEFIGSIVSLGGEDSGQSSKWTPLKRKLDGEFESCQVGGSISGGKSKAVIEVQDDEVQVGC